MDEIRRRLEKIVKDLFAVDVAVSVTPAPENTGADYASNVAMQLAKIVHRAPMVIAQQIQGEFSGRSTLGVDAVEIAAPGFLNFKVSSDDVAAQVGEFADDFVQSVSVNEYAGKTVVAEFSDPNPFKVLHVGHLYTSIVGDSISRLLEFAGAEVVRANFGGDVGLHVAKTLYSILEKIKAIQLPTSGHDVGSSRRYGRAASSSSLVSSGDSRNSQLNGLQPGEERYGVLGKKEPSSPMNGASGLVDDLTIEDIAKCYVEGTRAYEEDEEARAEITRLNKEIYRINAEDLHDSVVAQLYWKGRELSYKYFDDFYQQIGVKFDKYYPESTVADRGLREVKAHVGTTYEESDGAIVYKGEKVGLHTRVFINREGVPTYETKDVGLIFTKWDDWHFDESIVVTGNEQSDYMKVVLASVSEYAPKLVERTTHLTHGMVRLAGNTKMSSRKGNFLKAIDTLQIVAQQLQDSFSERSTSSGELVEDNQQKIVLAAIKYAFLKYKMGGDIIFDPKESVSTTGNSGVYLLYSAVRAKKILQKQSGNEDSGNLIDEEQKYTKDLNKKIVQYRDVLREAVKEKAPYKICNYLYELAQEFSRFYEHVKVAGSACEKELMKTVRAYENVMVHGLGLLGIAVPEEM